MKSPSRWLARLALAATAAMPLSVTQAASPDPDQRQSTRPVHTTGTASTRPADWRDGVFMQIYVRGYQDSDGDGTGDLRGLISRLDYLESLGIRGIWLMPVTRSQDRDHGYATTDYRDIESDYGTLADFDELLKQAHARGIGVIIDYVINHSGADHPLFQESQRGPGNRWRDWYVWEQDKPAGWQIYGNTPWYESDHGWYFAGFWSEMPDFNLRNPAVLAWHHDNLRFWLDRGVDGFRFDAVGNLVENGPLAWEGQPENHRIMHGVRRLIDGHADRFMVCEAPGDPLAFAAPDSCGSSFAFGHQNRIVAAALGSPAAIERVAHAFDAAPPERLATFVSNHDAFAGQRLWDRVRGDEHAYRLAAATYLLQPGRPFIYYGEEIGMAGGRSLGGDHRLRTPMSWNAEPVAAGFSSADPFRALSANARSHNVETEQADPGSLLNFYRALIGLRNRHASLSGGQLAAVQADGWIMSFQRIADGDRTLVVFNYKADPVQARVSGLPPGVRLEPLWPASGQAGSTAAAARADQRGQWNVRLPARSFIVMQVSGDAKR